MRRLLVLAAAVLGAISSSASGATIGVTTEADALGADGSCSLREAVMSANNDTAPYTGTGECAGGSGADTIVLPPGNYARTLAGTDDNSVAGDLDVASEVTISGAGAASTTIDAAQKDRVIDVLESANVTIQGVTITGGRTDDGADAAVAGDTGRTGGDGGALRNQGTLTLRDCVVAHNRTGDGGAAGAVTGAKGTDGTTQGGTGGMAIAGQGGGGGGGGGVWNSGSLTLTRVVVTANTTGNGGAGAPATGGEGGAASDAAGHGGFGGVAHAGPGGQGGSGGGVFTAGGSLTIDGSTISDNATGHGGIGGLGQGGQGGPTAATTGGFGGPGGDGHGGGGGLGGPGGGIFNSSTTTSITRSLIVGNITGAGSTGGVGTGAVGGASQSSGSSAPGGLGGGGFGGPGGFGGYGGGIFTSSAELTNLTIATNKTGAGGAGGSSAGGNGGPATTLNEGGNGGNGTGGDGGRGGSGGGVAVSGSPTSIAHLTLTGNLLGSAGVGGTATGGSASNGGTTGGHTDGAAGIGPLGGGIYVLDPISITESNSITQLNAGPGCTGTIVDGGHNINNGEGACPGVDTDPKLGPLADNGGATLTQRPNDGSPAIDGAPVAGCAATDQRGVLRPFGPGCDIGAYERAAPAVAITAAAASVQGTVTPNGQSATYHFEFGTTTDYGSSTADATAGGVDPVAVAADLPGLAPSMTYHVRLVAANADGSSASADATFTTAANPPPAQAGDTTAPVILSASVKPKSFRRKHGTTFHYKLSEKARVAFTIHRKKGKRYVKAKTFSKASKQGANTRKFATRRLKPGRYRATLVATDAAKNHSKPKRLTFRIRR